MAHVEAARLIADISRVRLRLNSLLPLDVAVDDVLGLCADAHAGFDASARKYEY